MRIDQLTLENFKKFKRQTFTLNPGFTLLVGDNGSGKTSVLDALAVALGLWHKAAPGSGWRNILAEEIRLEPVKAGDRISFQQCLPTQVSVTGSIGEKEGLRWTRMIRVNGTRTTNAEAKDAQAAIANLVSKARAQQAPLPVLAYYGAGRAWQPTNKRQVGPVSGSKPRQLDAYRYCLDTRIREKDINDWFLFETAASATSNGRERPGYVAVKLAVLGCIPEADGLRYDADLKEIVLSIGGSEQPFHNLSAGQRMMLALVADIAIKAVTLNSYLLSSDQPGDIDSHAVLRQSPGVVLIDELDVHLHPRWQRRVTNDLKRTFPRVQFIATSHSPQVIGELAREEIRMLEDESVAMPRRSLGIDSNRILGEVMNAEYRDRATEALLESLFRHIQAEDFGHAKEVLKEVAAKLGHDDPEVARAETLMSLLEDS